jgi:hypothetical protein
MNRGGGGIMARFFPDFLFFLGLFIALQDEISVDIYRIAENYIP